MTPRVTDAIPRGNGERDAALGEDVEHLCALQYCGERLAQHGVALPHVTASDEYAPDRAERALTDCFVGSG